MEALLTLESEIPCLENGFTRLSCEKAAQEGVFGLQARAATQTRFQAGKIGLPHANVESYLEIEAHHLTSRRSSRSMAC
ncbi:hypothetical protein DQG23_08040 [Paenibacillus contaminans]|uniref:Uncharacterized protein n=1 Tax=Paenibacillus contaminans TaxID=450362 RepID=A0A329MPX8_9BACL|nr:hypothetical protein DQG23_08040 [Paenibacillus contaminans]